jgi:hypothetical protein
VGTPPYQIGWRPTEPGAFYVWARSTNNHGVVHESSRTQFIIYAANDSFAGASVIAANTRATNIAFDLAWATAETNEPPHKTTPAINSLWWTWTPAYSGPIRLKAVQSNHGLPLDVFVGTALADLRRIANNDRCPFAPGWSGVIPMRVKAGETYYIRADYFAYAARGPGAIPGTLAIEPGDAPTEATLNFSFFETRTNGSSALRTHPRVFFADCRTPVTSSTLRAQLYAGQTAHDLVPVGEPQRFFGDSEIQQSPELAGRPHPSLVVVPGTKPGRALVTQIRVWDSAAGSSYEAAQAGGGSVGTSGIFKALAGSEAVN